ncbi:thioesterase II family protein [Streptomyces noursei]|uniref:thioesterase II family protein n=1 Tax=Streptomyces noursei TaxID=1971 RepID=UPI000687A522|nr:alpha/beta fold hydrolase [Streptomyces noursei]UWS76906.1 alpha/beta fold hydrolase [Streptomyces noursei]
MAPLLLPYWGRRIAKTKMTIFCLPHAGGSAAAYIGLARRFPAGIDVQPVELPGREALRGRPPFDDVAHLVEALGTELLNGFDGAFALLGHSMGAVIAFELAAWLERHGGPLPELLIVSGSSGAAVSIEGRAGCLDPAVVTDEQLTAWLGRMGGTPTGLLLDEEMRRLVLGVLRSDLQLLWNYRPSLRQLTVPLLALGGEDDAAVPLAELHLWLNRTSGGAEARLLPGGHFYLYEKAELAVPVIVQALREVSSGQ